MRALRRFMCFVGWHEMQYAQTLSDLAKQISEATVRLDIRTMFRLIDEVNARHCIHCGKESKS